jgi:hypothetical protein
MDWVFGGTLMSIFNASSLRKLESTPFILRVRQKDSGVGISTDRFSGLRSPKPVSFSKHVRTEQSGVAAPADSLEISSKAETFGARMTKGLRIAAEENLNRQTKINQGLKLARRFSPGPLIDISSTQTQQPARPNRFDLEANIPLNGAYSLSITASQDFPPAKLRSTETDISRNNPYANRQKTNFGNQAIQSYTSFEQKSSNNAYSAEF